MTRKKKKTTMGDDKKLDELAGGKIVYAIREMSFAEDDDVFLADAEIYTDMSPQKPAAGGRIRRASDVIDSLGEEFLHGCSIPISPQRTSVDLGYSGSVASSPAPVFTFPPSCSVADGIMPSMTDANPIASNDTYETSSDTELEARMPVAKEAEEYNMSHPRRGLAVILNHEFFDVAVDKRTGTSVDVTRLTQAYEMIGFDVVVHHNLAYNDILTVLANLAKQDHSDCDCLIVTVMTHGMSNGYLHSRDHLYNTELLWMPFSSDRCPTLAGKPKLFFIQACRGTNMDNGITLTSRAINCTETDSSNSYKIPSQCDFLISFSSMDGYYSWRNPEEGTWFIQSLAEELEIGYRKQANLLDIMTRVHRRVALTYESMVPYLPDKSRKKQCPMYHSSLIRDLIFKPKA